MTERKVALITGVTGQDGAYLAEHVNAGSGSDVTILDLAEQVCAAVGFAGGIERDLSKPDGTPRKVISGDKLAAMGWQPRIGLREGIADAYRAFLASQARTRLTRQPARSPTADVPGSASPGAATPTRRREATR